MSKKLHSKLLSVILIIAICCATLCGSLIAAHAAADDYTGTYTISVGDEKNAVPFGATEVAVEATFTLPAGFMGGEFTVTENGNYTIGDTVTVVDGTTKDGSEFNAAGVETVVDGNDIVFLNDDGIYYTSITLKFTLVMSSYVKETTGATYNIAITADGANFIVEHLNATVTFEATDVSDTSFHAHSAWYNPASVEIEASKDGHHTVTTANCVYCQNVAQTLYPDYSSTQSDEYNAYRKYPQILPDYTEFDGALGPISTETNITNGSDTACGWLGISGVTMNYLDNGNLNVDIHAYSEWRTDANGNDKIVLIICDENGNELYRLPSVANGSSYYKGNGFPETEKMFTLTNLSARDIDTKFLLTAVEYSADNVEHSRTMSFCIADYCEKVVTGDGAIWYKGTTEEQIDADKDVAAALYYYGAAINDSVFDKNTGTSTTINYEEKDVVVWDGVSASGLSDTTSAGTKDEPIKIYTPGELHYLALKEGLAAEGKYYKIADGIKVFDMNNYVWSTVDNTNPFAGHFDGNGVIIKNLKGENAHASALFGTITTNNYDNGKNAVTDGLVSFENITIMDSSFTELSTGVAQGAAAIVGWNCGGVWNSANTGSLTINNCKVINTSIEKTDTAATVGVFCASMDFVDITITNCLVSNVTLSEADANNYYGGFIGQVSDSGYIQCNISNSVCIGNDSLPMPSGKAYTSAKFVYSNVYTDQSSSTVGVTTLTTEQMTGSGAVATMNLGSDWFDTASYPELSVFHKLTKVYIDETSHKTVCVHQFVNGDVKTPCDLAGITEEHVFDIDEVDYIKECECGYTVDILGNYAVPQEAYSDTWDGSAQTDWTYDEESGCYIISTAEQLYAMITNDGKVGGVAANFKVADNIKEFYLTDIKAVVKAGNDTDTIMSAVKNSSLDWNQLRYNWTDTYNATDGFVGNFDGNGVTIYGMRVIGDPVSSMASFRGGFIPTIKNDTDSVTIKNISFKYSYVQSQTNNPWFGVVVGSVGYNNDGITGKKLTFDNVRVENVEFDFGGYDGLTANAAGHRGGLCGFASGTTVTVNNSFVSDISTVKTYTSSTATPTSSAFVSSASAVNINNSVAITDNVGTATTKNNTYIIATSNAANAKGTAAKDNMPLLDWEKTWFTTTDGYPELHAFHDMITECIDENTHQYVCQHYIDGVQCPVNHAIANHTLEKNDETNSMVCTCGYSEEINGTLLSPTNVNYDVWDGTKSTTFTSGEGTKEKPYLIETAEQLAGVALSLTPNAADWYYDKSQDTIPESDLYDTLDKYYIVKENSVFNMNGMQNINLNSTADEVKTATVNSAYNWTTSTVWKTSTATYSTQAATFAGNFNGNGLVVYNLYSYGEYSGLFPHLDQNNTNKSNTIENVTVTNSKIIGMTYAGGIIGFSDASVVGYPLNMNNCVVKNTYLSDNGRTWGDRTAGGLIGSKQHSATTINNCMVKDNIISAANVATAFVGWSSTYAGGTFKVDNSIAIGASPYATLTSGSTVTLPTPIDSGASYSNVYTDVTLGTSINGITVGIPSANALGSDWFDTTDGYPELHAFHDMKTVTIDSGTHQYMCQHYFVDDGAYCDVCQAAEAHTFTEKEVDGVTVASCEDCNYSYKVEGIYQILENSTVILNWMKRSENEIFNDFVSNAAFKAAYAADSQTIQSAANNLDIYATSLNLKVNPYIAFTFAFNSPYLQDRQNITINFTVGNDVYTTNPPEYVQGEHFSKTADSQLNGNWTNNKGAGRYHLYRFTALPVSKLCEPIKVSVVYKDKTYAEGTYSVAGYAIEAINAGEDYVYHANASMALVYYSEMLAKYLAN